MYRGGRKPGSRNKEHRIAVCHPDRPYHANGLCKPCCDRARPKRDQRVYLAAYRDDPNHPERRDKANAASRAFAKRHPDRMAATLRKRRARKLGQTVHYTPQEWQALKRQLDYKCVGCGKTETELQTLDRILVGDHIVPLAKGGLDSIENIQPLCHSQKLGSRDGCNNKKAAKIYDFLLS